MTPTLTAEWSPQRRSSTNRAETRCDVDSRERNRGGESRNNVTFLLPSAMFGCVNAHGCVREAIIHQRFSSLAPVAIHIIETNLPYTEKVCFLSFSALFWSGGWSVCSYFKLSSLLVCSFSYLVSYYSQLKKIAA